MIKMTEAVRLFLDTMNAANLSASTRWVLHLLCFGDASAEEIGAWAGMGQRQVYRHLAILRLAGFIDGRPFEIKVPVRGGDESRREIQRRTGLSPSRRAQENGWVERLRKRTGLSPSRRAQDGYVRWFRQALGVPPAQKVWRCSLTFERERPEKECWKAVKGFIRYVKSRNGHKNKWVAVLDRRDRVGEVTRLHFYVLISEAEQVEGRWWSHGKAEVVLIREEPEIGNVLRYAADIAVCSESMPHMSSG